jgi:hypothetical protein
MHADARSTRLTASLGVLAIVLGLLCILDTVSTVYDQTAFSEYLSQARRCVELNDCPSVGGRTGGLPLFHGASWIRLLSYSLRNGQDLTQVQDIVLGLLIASIPVTFFFLQRYLGVRSAALALGLYFPVIIAQTDITMLTYTNLLPLPFALYYVGIALFIESGRTRFAALASIPLAAAVSAELGGIVMVPFHLALVGLAAPRPLFAVGLCGLSFAIPFCLDSMDAALAIVRQIPTLRFAVALVICFGAVPFVIRLRPQLQFAASTPAVDRVRTVMTAALVYTTVTIWLGNILLMSGVPAPRYFLPASFPFLYLVAERMGSLTSRQAILLVLLETIALLLLPWAPNGLELVQVPISLVVTLYAIAMIIVAVRRREIPLAQTPVRWPAIAICVCAIGISIADASLIAVRGGVQTMRLAAADFLVRKLYSDGYAYPEVLGAIQGPAADDMMALLTERDPQRFTAPPPYLLDPSFSLLVVETPNDVIAKTQGVIATVPSGDSRSTIIVRSGRPYLNWVRMRRCAWTSDGGRVRAYGCAQPRMDRPLPHNWPYVEFGDPLPSDAAADGAEPHRARFEVPVHTAGSGVPHIVRTPNRWPAAWQIVRVTGVEFEGALPGAEIRLPDTREESGVVEFEFEGMTPRDLPWVWLPHVLEVEQVNEHLLEPFRRG